MFLIEKALEFWVKEHAINQAVDWKKFPYFTQKLNKLTEVYFLSTPSNESSYEIGKSKEQWTSSDMLGVMKQLVAAPQGVLSYYNLREEFGGSSIDSLIEHNIIHLRPSCSRMSL